MTWLPYTPLSYVLNLSKKPTFATPSLKHSASTKSWMSLTSRYTQKCSNLLTQYKAILKDAEVQERFGDLDHFQKQYNVQFTSATYRLKVGVPATVEHAGSHHHIPSTSESPTDQVNARHIAETVEVAPTTRPHRNSALDFLLTVEIHYVYGRTQTELSIKRSITSTFIRFNDFVEYEYATRL